MVRTHGRCRRGQRLIGKAPWGHWKTTTFTAGLRCDGIVAPFVLEGPILDFQRQYALNPARCQRRTVSGFTTWITKAGVISTCLWGATKIHGELLKLGIDVARSTVSIYMVPRPGRPLQTWQTFLHNHAEGIASMDLFVVPTIGFQQLFACFVLAHQRRQLLWFAVTRNPTAKWLARQITEAFPWDTAPRYLVRDNDRAFGAAFKERVQAMGIRDQPTSFRSPWQNGHLERLIRSTRRECTGHLIVFNEAHLRRILSKYARYYNQVRTHLALGKDAPCGRPVERFGDIVAHPILGGLHHQYARI